MKNVHFANWTAMFEVKLANEVQMFYRWVYIRLTMWEKL